MNLLTIRNQREYDAAVAMMVSAWGAGIQTKHVDAVKGDNNTWTYSDGEPLWPDLIPQWGSGSQQDYLSIFGDGKGGFYPLAHDSTFESWSMCEYDVLFVPPTGPARTLKTPNLSVCGTRLNVTDATTGAIQKGICRVADSADFPTASSRCIGYGMRLLTIRNQREFDAMVQVEKNTHGATPPDFVVDHIAGAKGNDGVWRFWDASLVPAFLIPKNGSGSLQNAINVKSNGQGGFYTYAADHTVPNYYFCEYSSDTPALTSKFLPFETTLKCLLTCF